MKKQLIEPFSYVEEGVLLVSKEEKKRINKAMTDLIESDKKEVLQKKRKPKTHAT